MQGYVCRCCGQYHDELPLHYGVEAPIYRFQEKEFHHEVTKSTKKLGRNTGTLGRFLRFLRFFVVYFS
jgi:hypothetical protein